MIREGINHILKWPRWLKRLAVIGLDIFLCITTTWVAFYLRLGLWVGLNNFQLTPDIILRPWLAILLALIIAIPLFKSFGFYRVIFRYSGWSAALIIARAIALYGVLYAMILTVAGVHGIPRTVGLIQPLLLFLAVAGSRLAISHWLGRLHKERIPSLSMPRVLIYGAGAAGRELAAAIRDSRKMQVVGFIDDDKHLQNNDLNGIKIYFPIEIDDVINALKVTDILLAIPSISRTKRADIIESLAKFKVSIRTLPSLQDLASGKISVSDIHDLDIEDLLGREPVIPDSMLLEKNILGKVVLVTGAGGTIGSELCRQIARQKPEHIILLEQSEFALYKIDRELRQINHNSNCDNFLVTPILGSVRSENLIRSLLGQHRPHIIFHAAAYKHVPLVEENSIEGILNNAYGTKNIANLASEFGVSNFVLISTDKAVRPKNIMGASKRLAEMILQAMAKDSVQSKRTIFSMVRFGNVLNSSGSVVPLFRKQIQDGGPVTVTHPEVTRYFMMIPEAAQLVIQASAMAKGGDVFVLEMGEPIKIFDLAKKMIALSGLKIKDEINPDGDIAIEVVGLRPGEKLYEELLIGGEPIRTGHPSIFRAHEEFISMQELSYFLDDLEKVLISSSSLESIKKYLQKVVTNYDYQSI
ncbi:polysaccharide biosynthesis protein [Polynucleobacter sp. MWH-P3-07-1]|uniref:polysaccharide biosynthesis protein n=1 Tax=Polynucleobacter sp. MWH-P3-07-1 TaxID=1743173 RepID=UPI001BFEE516|nr:nucleoside-diphosphate sugar epimerase/dehydratase [Polynucleobacter sp. MWH-P3-07-1]QWD83817.1 polysaccharide biosynthesis protein [Polynucleobacter sp. MWH-P3-07-1]